jgi:hypothetical protein
MAIIANRSLVELPKQTYAQRPNITFEELLMSLSNVHPHLPQPTTNTREEGIGILPLLIGIPVAILVIVLVVKIVEIFISLICLGVILAIVFGAMSGS